MSLTDRDRKIAIAIVPLLVLAAYWFLLLAPKREEAATASKELTKQTERRDTARTAANAARGAKTDFAADYGEIVRLGKAIPAGVDMPSLLVQLDRAAEGTGIRFTRVGQGQRTTPAPASTAPAPTDGAAPADGSAPVDAGGAPAQSAPGSAVESANNTAQTASTASTQSDAAAQSGVDATTSSSTGNGGLPVGGGATTPATPGAAATGPTGLETVPLELQFVGNFFNLADFFHDVKRFVRVANENVLVSGRLITIEGVKFASDPLLFPKITAEMTATVYLSPKAEGMTAGATPQGPAPAPGTETTPASTPASTPDGTTTPAAPTATATP
jgi:Tfp pilus assembly protein PilO